MASDSATLGHVMKMLEEADSVIYYNSDEQTAARLRSRTCDRGHRNDIDTLEERAIERHLARGGK